MIIKNAYYPKQLPTQIVVELPDGKHYETALAPFRHVTEDELKPLAIFGPEMGDEIPGYTLKFYGFVRDTAPLLKRLRMGSGLTQAQLAEAAGINVRQIQKIESGEIQIGNVTLANAARIAQALGVKIEALLE